MPPFTPKKLKLSHANTHAENTQKLISKMDQLTNLPVFKSIQISLACQACIDAEKTHEWYGCMICAVGRGARRCFPVC